MAAKRANAAMRNLKTDDFICISIRSYCKNTIFAFLGCCHLIVDDAIVEEVVFIYLMTMTIEAEHEVGEVHDIIVERLEHIIIKLLAIWRSMHTSHTTVEERRVASSLSFEEVEVGHRLRVVVLYGIGIYHYEFYSSSNEREVVVAKHLSIDLVACAKAVVVALHDDERFAQAL